MICLCVVTWGVSWKGGLGRNKITIRNKDTLLDTFFCPLHKTHFFTKLDLQNTYHLIQIQQGDERKTTFNTPQRHFEDLLVPFGLTNGPAIFQALVNVVLWDILNRLLFVDIDYILIFSETLEEHIQHIWLVLPENKLFVKAEKCRFHITSVTFLGLIIQQGQLSPNLMKVSAMRSGPLPLPENSSSIFWVLPTFFSSLSEVAARWWLPWPVWYLPSSHSASPMKRRQSSLTLSLFTSAPILVHLDPSCQFVVEVDASDIGIGTILSQQGPMDQKHHPCGFFSGLTPSERNYDMDSQELCGDTG